MFYVVIYTNIFGGWGWGEGQGVLVCLLLFSLRSDTKQPIVLYIHVIITDRPHHRQTDKQTDGQTDGQAYMYGQIHGRRLDRQNLLFPDRWSLGGIKFTSLIWLYVLDKYTCFSFIVQINPSLFSFSSVPCSLMDPQNSSKIKIKYIIML